VLPKMADHWLADEYTPQRTPYVEHEFTRSYFVGNNRAGMCYHMGAKIQRCSKQWSNSTRTHDTTKQSSNRCGRFRLQLKSIGSPRLRAALGG
jgi:hypothetical protein